MTRVATPDGARFAGWRILAFATVVAAMTGPGQTIGVSVFVDHLETDLGLSSSAVAGAYLVGTLAGSSTMPAFGRYVDRVGARRATTVIALGFAAALVNVASVRGLVWLAIGFTGIRMLGQGALSLVSGIPVAMWFERRRGLAMGIMATVVSGLMALSPIALNALIGVWGWRRAWLVSAAAVVAVVVPIARFGIVDRPQDIGQQPDGGTVVGPRHRPQSAPGLSVADALRSPAFWTLAAAAATVSMLVTGLNFHQLSLLGEAGLTESEAALMFLPQVVGAAVCALAFGWIIDRASATLLPAVSMVLLAGALVLGSTASTTGVVVLYAVLLGTTMGSMQAMTRTLVPKWFGLAHLGSIQGALTFVMVAASAAGPFAFSLVETGVDSYQSTARIFALVPVAVAVVAAATRPDAPSRPEVPTEPALR